MTRPGKIYAFDLGTHTGIAIGEKESPPRSFMSVSINFTPKRHESSSMRFLRFQDWLSSRWNDNIERIYYEEVARHVGTTAAQVHGGFLAILQTWAERRQIPYVGVPVGTIKKHATGKGNAGKAEMIAAMQAKGHELTDDNEADALALLYYALEQ